MNYYIYTIEQYKQTEEEQEVYVELAKVTKKNTLDSALGQFYDFLSTVAKSPAHNYLDIKLVRSDGGIIKKDVYGAYVDPDTLVTSNSGGEA